MGNKVHPKGFRTGVIYGWNSKWFAKRNFPQLLRQDIAIRRFLEKKLKECAVDHVEIERTPRALNITIYSAKPGFIIGRGGSGVEDLKKQLKDMLAKPKEKLNLNVNIIEVSNPSLSANIVLNSMIADLERRMPFRRVLKQHLDRVQKAGAKGVKLQVKGRLNGAEIARDERLSWGSVPLHNLRADVDYAAGYAHTLMGSIGVKVWIYRGDVFGDEAPSAKLMKPPPGGRLGFDRRGPRRGAPPHRS